MACNKCKKKKEREYIEAQLEKTESIVKFVFVIIVGLSIYGLYSLFSLLL
jgi:hypothetical protein